MSDYRLKTIECKSDTSLSLAIINKVTVYDYTMDYDSTKQVQSGFIAHELEEYVPWAIQGKKDDTYDDGSPRYQRVGYGRITPILWSGMQELNNIINDQQKQIDDLKFICQTMNARLLALES